MNGRSRSSERRAVALVLACRRPRRARDGRRRPARADSCMTVQVATSPEKLELLTDLAKRFEDSEQVERQRQVRPGQVKKVSSGGESFARRRLAEAEGQRAPASHLVAVSEHAWDLADPTARPSPARAPTLAPGQVVHAHAARDRDAQADGPGTRVGRTRRSGSRTSLRLRRIPPAGRARATRNGDRSASARRTPTSPQAAWLRRSPSTTRPRARRETSRSRTSLGPKSRPSSTVWSLPSCTTATPRSRS